MAPARGAPLDAPDPPRTLHGQGLAAGPRPVEPGLAELIGPKKAMNRRMKAVSHREGRSSSPWASCRAIRGPALPRPRPPRRATGSSAAGAQRQRGGWELDPDAHVDDGGTVGAGDHRVAVQLGDLGVVV